MDNYKNAKVLREDGRIDVLVYDQKTRHAIIIENKINDAIDMYKQIPRYLQYIEDDRYVCDAIIYLKLLYQGGPDQTGWTDEEKRKVAELLKVVTAYDDSDQDFYSWIGKCVNICNNNSDAQFLLKQYGSLLRYLGRNTMNKSIMMEFYKKMLDSNNYQTALSVKAMLDDLILFRAERIMKELNKYPDDQFGSVHLTKNRDVVYYSPGLLWDGAHLGIDIEIHEETSTFRFWVRDENQRGKAKVVLDMLGIINDYRKTKEGYYIKEFKFPDDEGSLLDHIVSFKRQVFDKLINT
jgi:hypothetical protein